MEVVFFKELCGGLQSQILMARIGQRISKISENLSPTVAPNTKGKAEN